MKISQNFKTQNMTGWTERQKTDKTNLSVYNVHNKLIRSII